MSEDMQNWRPFLSSAATKINSFKGYLASKDPRSLSVAPSYGENGGPSNLGADIGSATKQSWTQWAGDKLRRNNQSQEGNTNFVETVSLFPGWAARRLHEPFLGENTQFDADVYVAGFASRLNNPDCMSRSQRAFLRLAKGFASLPKLQLESQITSSSSEMMEVKEMQCLEEQFRKLDSDPDTPSDPFSAVDTPLRRSPSTSSQSSSSSDIQPMERASLMTSTLQELHSNLERRLMPFWSSSLSNRTIRISLYASEEAVSIAQALGKEAYDVCGPNLRPIASQKVTTAQDGSFQFKFGIPWRVLSNHPGCLQVAFGDVAEEQDFFILAELLPPPPPPPTSVVPQSAPVDDTPVPSVQIKIPLSYTPLRVVSDIDDTVKMANVLAGARTIFYTVFVRSLAEIVIPGMGDWYTKMWQRGARFHYVSNGPFEVLPILNEFFPLAKLPPGSIKLRSYAGRSLFNGFLSAPAARKRQGVIDILSNFPESQFILVGDSGEQDMELYATVAMERPEQILAVFIRDARSPPDGGKPQPIEDPVGASAHTRWMNHRQRSDSSGSSRSFRQIPRCNDATSAQPTMTPGPTPFYQNRQPPTPYDKRQGSMDYFSQSGRSSPTSNNNNGSGPWFGDSQFQEEPTTREIDISVGLGPKPAKMTDAEWRRLELQMRVDRARVSMPQGVRFRLFINPEECVEAFEVLDQLNKMGHRATMKAGRTPLANRQPDSWGNLVDI